jgi:ABC-type proline/glycine betaine transport system ATPase subunit
VGLKAFQRLVAVDNLQRLHNQERLQELHAARSDEVTVFSAHDPDELAALAQG